MKLLAVFRNYVADQSIVNEVEAHIDWKFLPYVLLPHVPQALGPWPSKTAPPDSVKLLIYWKAIQLEPALIVPSCVRALMLPSI